LLTGNTVDTKTGLYRYDPAKHAVGPVTVIGFTHPNTTAAGGQDATFELLDYLALHPATAQRIAYKLCVRFVADEPPATLVTRLAQVYLAEKSAIAPVLRALLTSAEFAASAGAKMRTPLEDLAATVRILGLRPDPGASTDGINALYWTLNTAGHAPMRWGQPDGYPDTATAWAAPTAFLTRFNAHLNLAAGWYPKQLTRPTSLLSSLVPGPLPGTHGALIDALARRLTGTPPPPTHTTALTAFVGKQPNSPLKPTDPAVNGRLPYLIALLLDSPNFQTR
jgi:uncharacterized protein (DUF1800 family)